MWLHNDLGHEVTPPPPVHNGELDLGLASLAAQAPDRWVHDELPEVTTLTVTVHHQHILILIDRS